MTFGRSRSRDRSRGNSSARVPLVLDFRTSALSFGTTVPAGCGYTRAACVSSVQYGTSQVFDLSFASGTANYLAWGRADDAWAFGLQLEEARTNSVLYARDYSNAAWVKAGTVTRTTGQSDVFGGTGATRVEVASGVNVLAETATGTLGAFVGSAWIKGAAPNFNVFRTSGATVVATTAASVGAWGRVSVKGDGLGGTTAVEPVDGRDWAAQGGLVAGARDVMLDACQREAGSFPTSYIPTSGGTATRNATFLRALSATVTPKLTTGRLSIELSFRAMGARTEYSGTHSLWYVDASNQASFVASTGVLTITVAGATNTCTLPAWARYDLVEISVQCGGSLATVVKYRLNSGAVTSLAITGTALGTHATGDVYLFSTNAGQHLSCWAYVAAFYAPGAPSWAS